MWQIPAAKEPPSTHKTFTFVIAVVGLACRPPLWGFTKPPENRRIWIEVSRDGRAGHAEREANRWSDGRYLDDQIRWLDRPIGHRQIDSEGSIWGE
jgi:hypothetical protein